jgi:septation ring formation regulator EzrA
VTHALSSHPVTHDDLLELRDRLLRIVETEGSRVNALLAEHDVRYEQRFRAQGEALSAALTAAEKAVAAALAAAEKASASTQAAADRAVQKAEAANEQRFGTIVEKLDSVRVEVSLITNTGAGLKAGWQYLIAALAAVSILYNLFVAMSK